MNDSNIPHTINSISEQHRLLSLPKPAHPLVSVFRYQDIRYTDTEIIKRFVLNFYCIAIKKNFTGKLKYGQNYYDFDEGVMSFISPGQLLSVSLDESPTEGYCLIFHPDFIAGYPLAKTIRKYGFFSYALYEALHLSEKEESLIEGIFKNIEQEYILPIDQFSQDVIVSHIELLLSYANRFYNRQFITRKAANKDLFTKLESLLTGYFESDDNTELPTVSYFSDQLNVTSHYLNDLLKSLTGMNTQEHIHNKLIEKAKEFLTATDLSVAEIAYKLGFEYPQSFNKLFKNKTNLSPLAFRRTFN